MNSQNFDVQQFFMIWGIKQYHHVEGLAMSINKGFPDVGVACFSMAGGAITGKLLFFHLLLRIIHSLTLHIGEDFFPMFLLFFLNMIQSVSDIMIRKFKNCRIIG